MIHNCQKPQPVSQLLPFDARMALVRAANTPVTEYDPLARQIALEEVQAMIKARFPEFFVKD